MTKRKKKPQQNKFKKTKPHIVLILKLKKIQASKPMCVAEIFLRKSSSTISHKFLDLFLLITNFDSLSYEFPIIYNERDLYGL